MERNGEKWRTQRKEVRDVKRRRREKVNGSSE